jgi:hypothetical protein
MPYTQREYAEMHYVYGYARGNAGLAARLYREQLIRRGGPQPAVYPDRHLFLRVHNSYMEGRLPGSSRRGGALQMDPDRVDIILEEVERDPSTSTRAIQRRTGIPRTSVHRILRMEGYHPYHIRKVQDLLPADYQRRIQFCEDMLRRNRENPEFFDRILWTDESSFTRSGIFNMHNYHSWSVDNPKLIRRHNFQHQFSINLWSGVLDRQLIGPFELPPRVTGEIFLNFLQNDFPDLMADVNLLVRRHMYFQCDGAPCHYSRIVRNHLDEHFPNKWIGRGGPITWPPRSPDLNPIDFFVWGHYKELVYYKDYSTVEELRTKLGESQRTIRENQQAFRNLKMSFLRRCRLCIEANGRHFEHLI